MTIRENNKNISMYEALTVVAELVLLKYFAQHRISCPGDML